MRCRQPRDHRDYEDQLLVYPNTCSHDDVDGAEADGVGSRPAAIAVTTATTNNEKDQDKNFVNFVFIRNIPEYLRTTRSQDPAGG